MVRPYSLDLRERVVAAVNDGESCRSVSARFGVSVSSVVKWSQRFRATGSTAPAKMGGYRPYLLEPHRAWLMARVEEKPDLTLPALLGELAERGIKVSCNTLWRFLRREGFRFKKNRVRGRAAAAGRGQTAGALEETSGQT